MTYKNGIITTSNKKGFQTRKQTLYKGRGIINDNVSPAPLWDERMFHISPIEKPGAIFSKPFKPLTTGGSLLNTLDWNSKNNKEKNKNIKFII